MRAASRQFAILKGGKHDDPHEEPGGVAPRKRSYARRLTDHLLRLAPVVGIVLVVLLSAISALVESPLSLTPLFLGPLIFVTWASGRGVGIALALASTIGLAAANILGRSSEQWSTFSTYWDIASQLATFALVCLIVSTLRTALDKEKELARTDPVTGAPNSRAFFEQLDRELVRSLRYNRPFTVAYLDADNFKNINDRFGHAVGDEVLRTIVTTVMTNIRSTDLFARIAGDEFTLLMPETGRKESMLVMSRLRKALSAEMKANGWPMTFSVGVVTYTTPPPSVGTLLQIADDVMYSVKHGGKDSVRHAIYDDRKGAA